MNRLGGSRGSLDKVADAARDSFVEGVGDWIAESRIQGGEVQGPDARLGPGSLTSTHCFEPRMMSSLRRAGADPAVASRLARELWGAWSAWAEGFQVQLPGAFPTLAAVPGPVAPPTPPARGVIPISLGMSTGEMRLSAPILSSNLKRAIASGRTETSMNVDGLAQWVGRAFSQWKSTAHLQGLIAEGPVPTFAPPYVPVGPVIRGGVRSTPGTPAVGGLTFGTGIR